MREFPRGGIVGKTVHFVRGVLALRVPVYAANACFFIVLAVAPALLLFLGLLRYVPLEAASLGALLRDALPEAFALGAERLIAMLSANASGAAVGISGMTALWSASRGMFGVLTGLNAVYGVSEDRGWLYTRFISVAYTFAFLVVLLATLGLQVFGSALLALLDGAGSFRRFLSGVVDFRVLLLFCLQTGLFTAMFMALPNRPNGFRESLPGAALASGGWLLFSKGYSLYVARFAHLTNVYGSVYALALSMLWLYWCLCIFFYGGALNGWLQRRKKDVSKP